MVAQNTLTPMNGIYNILRILFFHMGLFLWFVWGPVYCPTVIYIILSIGFCFIHQREMSEWLHEASHFNLFPNSQNDFLVNGLVGPFVGSSVQIFRLHHFKHHKMRSYFKEDLETSLIAVSDRRGFWRAVMMDLCGLTAIKGCVQIILSTNQPKTPLKKGFLAFFIYLGLILLALITFLFSQRRLDIYVLYFGTFMTVYMALLSRLEVMVNTLKSSKAASAGCWAVKPIGLSMQAFSTESFLHLES